MRIFRLHFQCDECPNEWETELLTVGPDWCPCCDRSTEPYAVVEYEDETVEDDEDIVVEFKEAA